MEATPAKWNVFNVICVPGSPILWAHRAPTAVPGSILALEYFSLQRFRKSTSWDLVQRSNQDNTDKKINKQLNIYGVFFRTSIVNVNLNRHYNTSWWDSFLSASTNTSWRSDRLLRTHAQVCGCFWKRKFFLRSRRNMRPHLAHLIRFRLYLTKTLKQWQYDSISYRACA